MRVQTGTESMEFPKCLFVLIVCLNIIEFSQHLKASPHKLGMKRFEFYYLKNNHRKFYIQSILLELFLCWLAKT